MPRVCHFTKVRTTVGRSIRYRGNPKYKGGIGLNITSITKRTFKPNLQRVTAVIDGSPQRIKVSAKAIKRGLVVKPLKRKYGYTRQQKKLQQG
jgi:large subunit ribosomal protein L28